MANATPIPNTRLTEIEASYIDNPEKIDDLPARLRGAV
jgi:hypothetical protein